jgi:dihydrofolate synthase/folylpolyglutamate synthase
VGAYEDTVAWLQSLEVTRGWDLKLERMRAALAARGNPEARFPALHVAGTNGKGSTAAIVEAVLRAAGRRTGLYTSPHLVDFTERIRAGGRTIPRDTVVALVAELRADLDAHGIGLTHFEFATLLALEWFARIGVDAAVVEVGLGGRLDATNLVRPIVTAVTSIAHDHEEYLGSSLAAIAREKAGIIKPGVPVVMGALPEEAAREVVATAVANGAPLVRVGVDSALVESGSGRDFRGPGGVEWTALTLALPGAFQRTNAAVALTMLAVVQDRLPCTVAAVRSGLESVQWPGRLAILRRQPLVVVDGAHNPEGIAALAGELPALVGARPLTLVFAVMADKAWRAMVERLLPLVARAVVTRVGRRGLDPKALADALADRVDVEAIDDPQAAIALALARTPADGAVLVTGSLFLAGEAYAHQGLGNVFRPWQGWGQDGTETPG